MLPPGRVYTLTVAESAVIRARRMLHQLGADTQENPFAPYVNLDRCPEFSGSEWCIGIGGDAVGSDGC